MGKIKKEVQLELFKVSLNRLVNKTHYQCQLASEIDWLGIEGSLRSYYSDNGRPSIPAFTVSWFL